MRQCEICNKHKVAFTNLETNEKICLKCGLKIQYNKQGIKGIFKVLKFYIENRWCFKWHSIFKEIVAYIMFLILWLISWLSLGYVMFTKQYWLIPSQIICILGVISGFRV